MGAVTRSKHEHPFQSEKQNVGDFQGWERGNPMKLLIFGATGRTGRLVVEQALAAGHEVIAYVRDPAKMTAAPHDRLSVIQGQLNDAASVDAVMQGVDAVIASLSAQIFSTTPQLPIAEGTRTILKAMSAHGVRRLVFCSGPSITLPHFRWNGQLSALFTLFKALPPTRLFIKEAIELGEAIRSSNIDWTTVVVVRPVDAPATGQLEVTVAGPGAKASMTGTSRHDLAQFLLDETVTPHHNHETVLVSN
jgi:putative NADH-flavin reductase